MAKMNFNNLLTALAAYVAQHASLEFANAPRAVWVHTANEQFAADVYTVLRQYGGDLPYVPVAGAMIQVKTTAKGSGAAAAFAQSQAIFDTLTDADGVPLRMTNLSGAFRANAVDFQQPPSFLSLDERGRAEVVFNIKLRAVALS